MSEEKNKNLQNTDDTIPELEKEIEASVEAIEEVTNSDESSFILPDEPDEYIENLLELELAQAEAEAEAELKKQERNKKNKEKARKQDKKALEEAREQNERDIAAENERLLQAESDRFKGGEFDSHINSGSVISETEYQSIKEQYENSKATFKSYGDNDVPETVVEQYRANADAYFSMRRNIDEGTLTVSPVVVPITPIPENTGVSSGEQLYPNNFDFSLHSRYPNVPVEVVKQQEEIIAAETEHVAYQSEQQKNYVDELNQAAIERQKKAEDYKSFGHEGIDYSGKEQHTAYETFVTTSGAVEGVTPSISKTEFQTIKDNYENSKATFKSYGENVPEAVIRQYRDDTKTYFTIRRSIEDGSLVVSSDPEPVHAVTIKPENNNLHIQQQTPRNLNSEHEPQHEKEGFSGVKRTNYRSAQYTDPAQKPSVGGFQTQAFYQNMAHNAAKVISQTSGGAMIPESSTIKASRIAAAEPSPSSFYTISQARYDSLKNKYDESMKRVASYNGKEVPQSVLQKNEQIGKVYFSIKNKVDNGAIHVVPENITSHTVYSGHKQKFFPNHSSPTGASFARGSQAFSDKSKDNFSPGGKRTGDSHIKPVGTPFQASPISKYDKLKVYHTNNVGQVYERATKRALGAIGTAFAYAARTEQTGTVSLMVSSEQRARDAMNAGRVAKELPRQVVAAAHGVKGVFDGARNAGRFVRGQERLVSQPHKPLTIKQIDKQLRNPFSSAEMPRMQKKFGANVNLSSSKLNSKIVVHTAQNKGIKAEIKRLQAKGASLTAAERKQLKALMDQKKPADINLRKEHGLKKARSNAAIRNGKFDRLSKKSLEKSIKKNSKKDLHLSQREKFRFSHMKDRVALLEQRNKLYKARNARKSLTSSVTYLLGNATRGSEDSSIQLLMSSDRVLQNRYVRSILKASTKAALLPVIAAKRAAGYGLKKLDNKLGVSKAVKQVVKKATDKAVGSVVNSRVFKEINGGLYNRAKKGISSRVPDKIKTRVKQGKKALNNMKSKRQAVLDKYNAWKKRLKNSKVGKFASALNKGFGHLTSALKFVKSTLIKVGVACGSFIIIIAIIGASVTSIGGATTSLFLGDDGDDGKVDLTKYVEILNEKEQAFLADIDTLASDPSNKYENVTVNYQSGTLVNNFKEILSMTAVYFEQDFSNTGDVKAYMQQLYNDSHYYVTVESEPYSCSGCEDRNYKCTDALDEYVTNTRKTLFNQYHDRGGCVETITYNKYQCTSYPGATGTTQQWQDYNKYHAQGGCVKKTSTSSSTCDGCVENTTYCDGCLTKKYKCAGCKVLFGFIKYCPGHNKVYCPGHTTISCPGHSETVETYSCPGHTETIYNYSCPGHTETICRGEHIDLEINVMVLGFDEIFYADSTVNSLIAGIDTSTGNVSKGGEIGTFTVTHYCTEKYPHICNAGPPYKTASGTDVTPGRTIAVDKSVIPLGTHVIINGHEYIAEDTGGAIKGKRVDVAVATHSQALQLGKKTYKVYYAENVSSSGNNNSSDSSSTGFQPIDSWDEESVEWAKNIYENMSNENYTGLDKINQFSGNNVSYEGVEFVQGGTTVVYYNQYDIRWKNLPYSTSTIGTSGCGPTSMAMIVSTLTDNTVDPIQMCNWSASNGYYVNGVGTSWSFVSGAASHWGLSCRDMGKENAQQVVSVLSSGKLVIMSTGPGSYYSGAGHFLVLRGVDTDGKILVADPASKEKSEQSWTLEQITSGLKNWWIIG